MTSQTLTSPRTLLAMSGRKLDLPSLKTSPLVLIDYQNEYLMGELALPGAAAAIERATWLLQSARKSGGLIIHVAHRGGKGGMFDRDDARGAFIAALSPIEGESVIEKPKPNSFAGTNLSELLGESGAHVIFAGFMTHMCVSSTVRAALDLGYVSTVAVDACATRDLPHPRQGIVPHQVLHDAELAALSDRFAQIVTVDQIV
jgi:nicotinamidase-related amidase